MKSTQTILTIILASAALTWAADEPKPRKPGGAHSPEEIFKHLDTNKDGKISLEEWKASRLAQKDPEKAAENFKHLDTNGDGFITLEEFKNRQTRGGKKPKK